MKKQTTTERKMYDLTENEPNVNFNAFLKVLRVYTTAEWEVIRISNKVAKLGVKQDEFYFDEEMEDYTIPLLY